ncbi:MAG: YfcE family phosphodiesterase [Clostridia bacterium]|nr:YfcE family phosphodiesterase [Clostridia bacterium]
MKLLVFSDVHGRIDRARDVILRHRDADAVLFLGDGLRDVEELSFPQANLTPISVKGNCDLFFSGSDAPIERMLRFGSLRVLMMHGYTPYDVKYGEDAAIAYAARRRADILLFGHTHERLERYLPEGSDLGGGILSDHPIWVMNPGSLGHPADGVPSYGLVMIERDRVLLSHGQI